MHKNGALVHRAAIINCRELLGNRFRCLFCMG